MATTSDATTSAQSDKSLKTQDEWKRNIWIQKTTSRLLLNDNRMVKLKSKEKSSPYICSIHRALLCYYSPYHDRLLNGNFAEGLTPPAEPLVVQANSDILKLFFTFLYTGLLQLFKKLENCQWHIGLTKLYILADELNCIALQRAIVSTHVEASKDLQLVNVDTIRLLSNSALESSSLYQWHVECFASHWNGTWSDGSTFNLSSAVEDPLPPNFAFKLLMKTLHKKEPRKQCVCCHDPCRFHGHLNEEERRATCQAADDDVEIESLNFETDPESESESESKSEPGLLDNSAAKHNHDDEETTALEAKRVRTI